MFKSKTKLHVPTYEEYILKCHMNGSQNILTRRQWIKLTSTKKCSMMFSKRSRSKKSKKSLKKKSQ